MIRTLSITSYLVDENGDYILTDPNGDGDVTNDGERIIVGEDILFSYDTDYMKVARFAKGHQVRAFKVQQLGSKWHLRVNRRFVGRFPTQEAALGCLIGMIYRAGCPTEERLDEILEGIISRGLGDFGGAEPTPVPPTMDLRAFFSLGTQVDAGIMSEPDVYYRMPLSAENDGTAPDYVMSEALDVIPGDGITLTLYPDQSFSGVTPSWKSFNALTWDGVSALPQMDPAEYVTLMQDQLDFNLISTADEVTVLIDWEEGTTNTARDCSLYWNDTANPQLRTALIELRTQQKAVFDALKTAFPNTFFGTYGGTVEWPNGNLRFDTSTGLLSVSGNNVRGRLVACTQAQIDQVTAAHEAALAGTETGYWDFHTIVAYDYFGEDALEMEANTSYRFASSLRPSGRKQDSDWALGIMKAEFPTVPALAILSPSNVAASHDQNQADPPNPEGWISPSDWVDVSLNQALEADGYLIWDGLRIDQMKFMLQRYDDWAAVVSGNATNTANAYWPMIEDMETQFGYLAAFASLFSVTQPTTVEDWFNIPRATRQSDASLNLFVSYITPQLRDFHLPMAESMRTTGKLPGFASVQTFLGPSGNIVEFNSNAIAHMTTAASGGVTGFFSPSATSATLTLGGQAADLLVADGDVITFTFPDSSTETATVSLINTTVTLTGAAAVQALASMAATDKVLLSF